MENVLDDAVHGRARHAVAVVPLVLRQNHTSDHTRIGFLAHRSVAARAALLHDVRELVCEQMLTGIGVGTVLA